MEAGDRFVSMTARARTHYYESRRRVSVEWLLVDVFKCSCLLFMHLLLSSVREERASISFSLKERLYLLPERNIYTYHTFLLFFVVVLFVCLFVFRKEHHSVSTYRVFREGLYCNVVSGSADTY